MKKILLLSVISCLTTGFAFAQDGNGKKEKDEQTNCYIKWAAYMEQRGAEDVEDGMHEKGIIITIRRGSGAECFSGKVEVSGGKIVNMWIKYSDGNYSQLIKKWKYEIKDVTIVNGISKTLITFDEELINVIFTKKAKPKKPAFETAPEPPDEN